MVARSIGSGGQVVRARVPRVFAGPTPRVLPGPASDGLRLVDLSYAGCAVEAPRCFAPGADLYLTFSIDGCLSFAIPAQVACSRPVDGIRESGGRHLVGFAFSIERQPGIHQIVDILRESMGEVATRH